MNIVVLTPYLPYPNVPHGGGQDLLRLIEWWRARGHAVRVAGFADAATRHKAEALRPLVDELRVIEPAVRWSDKARRAWAAARSVAWRDLGRRAEGELRAAIEAWAAATQMDVLYCAWTEMGRCLRLAPNRTVRVLDEVDVRFVVEAAEARRRPWQWARAARRRREEVRYLRAADLVVTRSARDLRAVQTAVGNVRVVVVPPSANTQALLSAALEAARPGRVLFVGALDRTRNQRAARWLAEDIWPRVRAAVPGAELRIVGANPPEPIRALGRGPGVTVTGWVDDLAREYAQARVVAAPMRSEAGALNKVMDGLAAGRPVVGTRAANAGVEAPPQAMYVADDAAGLAAAIGGLLRDEARWRAAAEAARTFAIKAFDWGAAAAALEHELERLVVERRRDSED
jgi:glycosyltransferase involved in cell wall biosynthesis